ncbi:MAG: acyl-CoA dehydrogenase family protein [Deltaproteobacteria bacterium]|nr:acyl-CoA dehydrogenase family protein [Deltaproteobacteria bacterium]
MLDLEHSPVKSFFLGQIVEQNIFPFPSKNSEQSETLRIVLDSIDKFMTSNEKELAEFDRDNSYSDEYLEKLKELGLFGLIIPEEYDGLGFSNAAYSRVMQQVSRYDGATAVTIGAHSSIGIKGLLLYGNEAQKRKYLPKLATGELIGAFCLTEANAGSDAASLRTTATKDSNGNWILNGEKIWISNSPFAGFFTVFARTSSEGGKLSAFIVEREFSGVSIGKKEDKMGIRASATASVSFDNVKVPAENLLGEEGKGFKIAVSILNNGRTGLGGGCIGGIKRCIELASQYSSERKQFDKSICEFGLVKEKLANMMVDCFATESVVTMTAHYIDSNMQDYSLEAAIAKVFASEALWRSANEAMQIAGGNGYMKEYPYEKIVRDSRINIIFEGTNEILRLFIALSGMRDAGEFLKGVSKSAINFLNDPIKGFGVLSQYASKKFVHFTSLGRDKIESIHPSLKEEAEIFEVHTLELSKVTESCLRKYGKNIVEQQFIMKRLADVAIELFAGLCVLSRVTSMINESSEEKCEKEIAIARIFSHRAKINISQSLKDAEHNKDFLKEKLADFISTEQAYPWDTI